MAEAVMWVVADFYVLSIVKYLVSWYDKTLILVIYVGKWPCDIYLYFI